MISAAARRYFAEEGRDPFVRGSNYWKKLEKHSEYGKTCEQLLELLTKWQPAWKKVPTQSIDAAVWKPFFHRMIVGIHFAHVQSGLVESYSELEENIQRFQAAREGITKCLYAVPKVSSHTGYDVPGRKPREFLEIGLPDGLKPIKDDIEKNLRKIDHYFAHELKYLELFAEVTRDAAPRPSSKDADAIVFVRHLSNRFEKDFGLARDSLVARITQAILDKGMTVQQVGELRKRWKPKIRYE